MKFLCVFFLAVIVSMCAAVPCTSTPRAKREANSPNKMTTTIATTEETPLPSKAGDVADVNTYKNKREANREEHEHKHHHKGTGGSTTVASTTVA